MGNKIYEVIFIDEYNNHYLCGFYLALDDAVDDLNGFLNPYEDGKYKIEKGMLKTYPSTYGECFNAYASDLFVTEDNEDEVYEELANVMIVGFIHEFSDEKFEMAKKVLL